MRGLLTGLVLENLLYTNIGIYPASHDQQARVKTLSKVLWEIKFNQNWMSPKGMSSGQGCVHLWIPLTFHTSSPHSFHNSLSPFWTEKTKVLWQLPPHPHRLAYQPPASVQHILLSHLSPAPFKAKPTASHLSLSYTVLDPGVQNAGEREKKVIVLILKMQSMDCSNCLTPLNSL